MRKIAVISNSEDDAKIFLAAICQSTVNNYVKVDGKEAHFDMLDIGNEVLYGSERLSGALKTSRAADAYSLTEALKNPKKVPDGQMGVSVRYETDYCGRIHFGQIVSIADLVKFGTDAVILLIRDNIALDKKAMLANCVERNIPIIAAVIPADWEQCKRDSAFETLDKSLNDNKITGRVKYAGWFDPYGFNNGERLSVESCKPYGIMPLLWNSLLFASEHSLSELNNTMRKNRHSIMFRASIFQKNSPRRVMELELARNSYAFTATKVVAAENLKKMTNLYFLQEE